MNQNDYLKDISDIKNMMNRSSQFISLSGLSGVLAGIYALIGAYLGRDLLRHRAPSREYETASADPTLSIVAIALGVLVLSVVTAFVMTYFKARRQGEKVWNSTSKRLIVNFLIPLIAGGILALILLRDGMFAWVAPVTLIFYGLACVHASKYTLRDVRYLGLTVVVLGLLAASYRGYGVEFWALGFGVCHIVYGSIMYFKYDRN
ncbi:hypothetical protein [Flavobacterium caeni]|uniref:Uncharacterized protein n=1 Tax=Flavobacterium caeni TaxID=490189 RepID=A0A1G5B4T8_9FLAO|nr:hypothetical protein [Flavobacterium caeni]SCX85050.1 hypothetical protein SAMN02927903_00250 [Flavobacterium caeni]